VVRLLGHSSVVLSAVIYRRWAMVRKRTSVLKNSFALSSAAVLRG
jgi:hypothetical protein